MTTWQALASESWLLYSPIGLRLLDDLTGTAPRYPFEAKLELENSPGVWRSVKRKAVFTPSGILSYPGLGRSASVAQQPVVRHRVRLKSTFYRPSYLATLDGIEFDVHPYDDQNPPAVIPSLPQDTPLLPSTSYPFPGHIRVLRGRVLDANANAVAHVQINLGNQEHTLSDERGEFALTLRWPAINAAITVDADDHRGNRNAQINLQLPGDLSHGHTITVN